MNPTYKPIKLIIIIKGFHKKDLKKTLFIACHLLIIKTLLLIENKHHEKYKKDNLSPFSILSFQHKPIPYPYQNPILKKTL
jgi:hypothetical protein